MGKFLGRLVDRFLNVLLAWEPEEPLESFHQEKDDA